MADPRAIVGKTVRDFRLKSRVSHEELAEKADLHRTYIGQVERGETNISLINLIRIAAALKVRPRELLRDV